MRGIDLSSPEWGRMPQLQGYGQVRKDANGRAFVPTEAGDLRVSLYEFGVRLRLGPDRPNDYGMLASEPKDLEVEATTSDGITTITGGDLRLTIEHEPLSFELRKGGRLIQRTATDGHFVRRFRLPPFTRVDDGWLISLDLKTGEPVYGLGEKWGPLNRRGQLVFSYNHDALGVNSEKSYKNIPFAWSPEGWGVFVHTPAPVNHGVGFAPWSQRSYAMFVDDPSLDVWLFTGSNGPELIDQFTALTGRAPVTPLWSLGTILSRAYYKDADEFVSTAQEVRKRGMPCDVITLDGRAWLDTETRFAFEFDKTRYPDPKAILQQVKDLNFKICAWEYPLVSVKNDLYHEMANEGWLLTSHQTGNTAKQSYRYRWDTEPFGEVLTPLPESGLVDFTHPDAYAFWRDRHKALFDLGIDMMKPDFGEQVQDDMQAYNGERGLALHNVYTLLYNRCVYEAAEKYAPNGAFLFSRSAWTSQQRYPGVWGGDPQADWEGMAASFRGGQSWGMTGAPYYATDIGGFYADQRDSKLFARWCQAGIFSAHMRLHGIGPREPWSYEPQAEKATMNALKLRYRLIPYLHKTMEQTAETGLPVQRAMALAFPDEKPAWAFDDQFMYGDDILVAPCLSPDDEVDVYLPQGGWQRWDTKEKLEGGQTLKLKLGTDETAVFVREGAKIPLGPAVEHTDALGGKVQIEEHWDAT